MVVEQVHNVFGDHSQTGDYKRLVQICETFWDESVASHRSLAQQILDWEMASKPHVLNTEAWDLAYDRALNLLQTRRQETCMQKAKTRRQTEKRENEPTRSNQDDPESFIDTKSPSTTLEKPQS